MSGRVPGRHPPSAHPPHRPSSERAIGPCQLLIALHQLGWAGLVTNDYRMLRNPADLAALLRTRLSVFAIEGVGHDPIRATGAVLLDLSGAIRRMLLADGPPQHDGDIVVQDVKDAENPWRSAWAR